MSEGTTVNIKMLVLSGSVLPSNYDFHKIMTLTDMKLINDCGCDDRILLLSEGLVPNTGMAGRVGFYGLNNARFVNRFLKVDIVIILMKVVDSWKNIGCLYSMAIPI